MINAQMDFGLNCSFTKLFALEEFVTLLELQIVAIENRYKYVLIQTIYHCYQCHYPDHYHCDIRTLWWLITF